MSLSFNQVLIFITVLFVTGLLKAVNKLFLNEKHSTVGLPSIILIMNET